MDKLTPKQSKFCELYATNGGNATQAAKEAGYKQARSMASENLTKHDIQAYIQELTQAETNERIATAKDRQAFWTSIMKGSAGEEPLRINDRLKASELLGKAQGDFIEKRELSGVVGVGQAKAKDFNAFYDE